MHRVLLVSLLLLALLGTANSAACDVATCVAQILNTPAYCLCLTNEIATCTGDNTAVQSAIGTFGCDGCRLFTSLPLIIGALVVLLATRY